ncbi:FadR/GntR family transcriptional regulator [Streptomyces sp. NEAU-H3]|uniref:FadR/GntR family transcriptional regulator n=1 Tax=Streptomyces sp. NEAU-H3 TaxID=2720636 RepID=UPI00143C5262|nr:FCD domain-containing protein [Streptomyces sp. NEAU-H3]NJA55857.1 FadR family transcriptional regulator [Streptomyces sp. NEAU-H3]
MTVTPERRDPTRRTAAGRAEEAAARIARMAAEAEPGSRLGTKEELRTLCEVSVGTLNEALRLLQARGQVTVKPGPGGGLFSARQSPMVRLGNSVLALDERENDVATAVRIRDALEPLLVEDALWHASPADLAALHRHLEAMEHAVMAEDPVAFVHANWRLHAAIAAISPNALLSSLYTHLLDLIESHTLSVLPDDSGQPLHEFVNDRYALHAAIVDALERRDREEALRLVHAHNTSADPGTGDAGQAGTGSGDAGHAGTGNGDAGNGDAAGHADTRPSDPEHADTRHADTSPSDAGHEMR